MRGDHLQQAALRRLRMRVEDSQAALSMTPCTRWRSSALLPSGLSERESALVEEWASGRASGRLFRLELSLERPNRGAARPTPHGPAECIAMRAGLPFNMCHSERGWLWAHLFSLPPQSVLNDGLAHLARKAGASDPGDLTEDQINLAFRQLAMEAAVGEEGQPEEEEAASDGGDDGDGGRRDSVLRVQVMMELLRRTCDRENPSSPHYVDLFADYDAAATSASTASCATSGPTTTQSPLKKVSGAMPSSSTLLAHLSLEGEDIVTNASRMSTTELRSIAEPLQRYIAQLQSLKRDLSSCKDVLAEGAAYDALGLRADANDLEVRRAYRRASRQLHPDRPGGDTEAFQTMQQHYDAIRAERQALAAVEAAVIAASPEGKSPSTIIADARNVALSAQRAAEEAAAMAQLSLQWLKLVEAAAQDASDARTGLSLDFDFDSSGLGGQTPKTQQARLRLASLRKLQDLLSNERCPSSIGATGPLQSACSAIQVVIERVTAMMHHDSDAGGTSGVAGEADNDGAATAGGRRHRRHLVEKMLKWKVDDLAKATLVNVGEALAASLAVAESNIQLMSCRSQFDKLSSLAAFDGDVHKLLSELGLWVFRSTSNSLRDAAASATDAVVKAVELCDAADAAVAEAHWAACEHEKRATARGDGGGGSGGDGASPSGASSSSGGGGSGVEGSKVALFSGDEDGPGAAAASGGKGGGKEDGDGDTSVAGLGRKLRAMQVELHGHNTRLLAALNGEVLELQTALLPRCAPLPASASMETEGSPSERKLASREQRACVFALLAGLMDRTCCALSEQRAAAVEDASLEQAAAAAAAAVRLEGRRAKLASVDAMLRSGDHAMVAALSGLRADLAMVIDLESEMDRIGGSSRALEVGDGWRDALDVSTAWLLLGARPDALGADCKASTAPTLALYPDVRSRSLLVAASIDVDAVCSLVEEELAARLTASIAGWGVATGMVVACAPAARLRAKLRCEEIVRSIRSAVVTAR